MSDSLAVRVEDQYGTARPLRWRNGVMENLGKTIGTAGGVNLSGAIVGTRNTSAGTFPFVLENGVLMELDSIPGGRAYRINDAGDVLGTAMIGTPPELRPVLWLRHGPISAATSPRRGRP